MKVFFMVLLGLVVAPIFWILKKVGLFTPPEKLPPIFEMLSEHLFANGISATGELLTQELTNVQLLVSFSMGWNAEKLKVVMVTLSENEELASLVEEEANQAPQYSAVSRNGRLVMACSFKPEDKNLEEKFGQAFTTFKPDYSNIQS